MKFSTTLLALAIATAAPNAFAQSADLSIKGKITPGACTVELGGGGIVDLGNILAKDLNPDSTTLLPKVSVPVTVNCESELRFALDGIDNTGDSSTTIQTYGLGLTPDDEKIGSAVLTFNASIADGAPAYFTGSVSNGQTWSTSKSSGQSLEPSMWLGINTLEGSDTGPSPIKLMQATLDVVTFIAPANSLTIVDEVPINGSVTIDLVYL